MASVGLNIYVDKENAVPMVGKGDGMLGSRTKGMPVQSTPRKAFGDVNKGPLPSDSLRATEFLKPPADAKAKLSIRPMNLISTPSVHMEKKHHAENKSLKKESNQSLPLSAKSSKTKKKVTKTADPGPDTSDPYDSDSIWPRAERLSSHMSKLLVCRPPCLFGTGYDSDSVESSDEEFPEQIIVDRPPDIPTMNGFEFEFDMASILADLPDPEKP